MNNEPSLSNQVLAQLPSPLGPHFVYREARWIAAAGRLLSVAVGLALAAAAMVSAGQAPWLFTLLFVLGAATLVLGPFYLRTAGATHFVATPQGLFFPEAGRFLGRGDRWLLVPWRNVLDYRVRRLLDETSRQGVVLELAATGDEAARFLDHRSVSVFSGAAGGRRDGPRVEVGYSTFLPSPEDVVAELRRHDGAAWRGEVSARPVELSGRVGLFMG